MQSRGSTRQWLCPQSLAEAQNSITVKMKGKCPTVLVINSNSDVPCSALLLPAGSISINTNLPCLTPMNTLGKLLIARENKCLCPAQDPTQNFLRRPEIFSFTPTCLWWFLHSTTAEPLKSPLCYMGRWFKQHQGCAIPELAAWEIRAPSSGFILPQVPSLDTSLLPFSAECWNRLMGWLWHDVNT